MPRLTVSNRRHHRRIAAFIALSLLIHGVLFFTLMWRQREEMPRAETARAPLSVRLLQAAPEPLQAAPAPSVPPVASAVPQPQPAARPVPKTAKAIPKAATQPKIARKDRSHPKVARLEQPAQAAPLPEQPAARPEPSRAAPPEMDMLSMLNAARERRRAAAMESAATRQEPASANEVALANIHRDLQRYGGARSGTGHVYVRLIHKGARTAQFQIRGFNPVSGDRWHQTIDVDAGPDGDVQLATVQKMIEWIRAHYSGDFDWESHRLDRVFTLSARPRDNAELQAFLMQEFFSS